MHNKTVHIVAFLLMAVGGLNWLLVGAFEMNLVTTLLGEGDMTRIVYVLVGLATVYEIINHKAHCTVCR